MEDDRIDDIHEDKANPVDSIVLSFSKLLKQLDNEDGVETCGRNASGTNSSSAECALMKLKKLHEEITEIQEGIEKFRLFKEGQDLYTKWLLLLEQSESYKDGEHLENDFQNSTSSGSLELDDGFRKHAEKFRDLIALSYNNRGYLKYLQVDFKGALEDYTAALQHNPTLACAYYNRGLVTYRLAFFEQAVQDMKTAVSMDPNRTEFHEGLQKVSEMVGSSIEHKFRLEYGNNGQDPENA